MHRQEGNRYGRVEMSGDLRGIRMAATGTATELRGRETMRRAKDEHSPEAHSPAKAGKRAEENRNGRALE